MLFSRTTYIGIDPTAGQRPFTYAALDVNLELLALGRGSLDEVTAFAGGQRSAVVSVNAPRQPNVGLMKDEAIRSSLKPVPTPGRWEGYRLAEYLLYQHNISIPRTPDLPSEAPRWMQMGFQVYQRLEQFGYQLYPLQDAECQMFETYPHGAFCTLLGVAPFPKQTLEGRLQRQLVLHERQLRIPNPMRFFEEITRHRLLNGILPLEDLFSVEELDALVAAYTAWVTANQPENISILGDPAEGQIILPTAELQAQYPTSANR
jgi:hypothetical protein